MSDHNTYIRPLRHVFLFGIIIMLAAIFWEASDILSSGFGRGVYPAELYASLDSSRQLPQGQPESLSESSETRDFYAQINDALYSPIHQPEAARLAAFDSGQESPLQASAAGLGGKLQCGLKASVIGNNNSVNSVAANSRECY